MKTVILNGKRMISKKMAHEYLKRKLNLPDHYGNNLDALWDILTCISEHIDIILINQDILYENIGDYGASLVDTFVEAMDENPNINFTVN